jgi:hypothetical protein
LLCATLYLYRYSSDGTNLVSKAVDPKKVLDNIRPVKHFHYRSLELAERFQLGVSDIPWDPTFYKYVLAKAPPGKKPSMSMSKKLDAARAADILRRAVAEPPVPPRAKSEAQLKKEQEEEKKAAKAAKKAMKTKATSKNLTQDTTKNLASFNPNRVVSDVEQCIINQTCAAENDLLGMTLVDFKGILEPGKSTTLWFAMDGCPSENQDDDEVSPKKEKKNKAAAGSPLGKALSFSGAAGGSMGSPVTKTRSLERSNGAEAKGPPEIELELSWSVFDEVKPVMKSSNSNQAGQEGDEDGGGAAGYTFGSLHVEVLRAADLAKPSSSLSGKMSSDKVMPRVVLSVARQSAKTSTARGVNPTFNEHFDFPGITSLDELTLSVVHPGKTSVTGRPLDRFMGAAVVPLHGVVKSGSISGGYALEGVKSGEVYLNLTYRAETNYDNFAAEMAAKAAEAAEAEAAAAEAAAKAAAKVAARVAKANKALASPTKAAAPASAFDDDEIETPKKGGLGGGRSLKDSAGADSDDDFFNAP